MSIQKLPYTVLQNVILEEHFKLQMVNIDIINGMNWLISVMP